MDACSQCPHPNDCLKIGSCLDEVNARYLAEHRNQFPRLMTSAQASIFMARLRAGESVRRMTSGSKDVGKALVPQGAVHNRHGIDVKDRHSLPRTSDWTDTGERTVLVAAFAPAWAVALLPLPRSS